MDLNWDRTPQEIVLQVQAYLGRFAELCDGAAHVLSNANNTVAQQLEAMAEEATAQAVELEQVMASFSGRGPAAQLQALCLVLTLAKAEKAKAEQDTRDRRAQMQEGANKRATNAEEERARIQRLADNNVSYRASMDYFAHAASAVLVLESLQLGLMTPAEFTRDVTKYRVGEPS